LNKETAVRIRSRTRCLAIGAVITVTSTLSCGQRDEWPPEQLAITGSPRGAVTLSLGRTVYERDCIGCHGPKGDGQGPAAKFLQPQPRDFTKGLFKFAGVPAGELPHDEDLLRTLRNGLHGTSMPTWALMPEEEALAVVQYVKTFSARWVQRKPGARIVPTEDPFAKKPEKGVELGRKVYHAIARCWGCHAAYEPRAAIYADGQALGQTIDTFRDTLYAPEPKKSDWGYDIKPPDFLVDPLKAGDSLDDLYRDIASGIGGTAMPMWRGALPEDQIWGLVHYVKTIVDLRGTPGATSLQQSLATQPPFTPPPPPPPPPEPTPTPAPSTSASTQGNP
jgi:mono/diheme cytochrome c family protein